MMRVLTKWRVAAAALLLAAVPGCGSDDPADPIVPSVEVGGLRVELSGATITAVSSALPSADNTFLAPTLTLDRTPTTSAAGTISVAAAEPFQTVLVQPTGSTSYARVVLPAATQLIGIRITYASGATSVATGVTVAVSNGTRTSRSTALSFLTIGQ